MTAPARTRPLKSTPPADPGRPERDGRTTVELGRSARDATHEAIERATVEMNGDEITVEIGGGSWSVSPGLDRRSPRSASASGARRARPRVRHRIRRRPPPAGSATWGSRRPPATSWSSTSGGLGRSRRAGTSGPRSRGRRTHQTVSGDVGLGTVTGSVSATLVSGEFAIDEAHKDLSAKTVSGDQPSARFGRGRSASSRSRATSASASAPARASGSTPTRRAATSARSST